MSLRKLLELSSLLKLLLVADVVVGIFNRPNRTKARRYISFSYQRYAGTDDLTLQGDGGLVTAFA